MLSQYQKKNKSQKNWLKHLTPARPISAKWSEGGSNIPHPTSNLRLPSPPNDTAKTLLFCLSLTPLSAEKRVIFWLCQDDKEAKSIHDNLSFWQKLKLKLVDAIKIHILNPEDQLQLSIINYQLFKNIPGLIVSTLENQSALPNLNEFKNSIITIKTKQNLNPQTLAQKLTNLGYNRNKTADQPGTFSIHGEIITIWTAQLDKPVKIELEFDKVNKMKKDQKKLNQIDIIPLNLKKSKKQEINKTMKQCNNACPDLSRAMSREQRRGVTIVTSDPTDSVLKTYENNPKIIFESFPTIINHKSKITNPPLYHNNLQNFTANLKKYQNKNYQIIIATSRKKSIQQLFKEKKIKEKNYLITQLLDYSPAGFLSQSPPLLLLTDLEIFGKDKVSPPTKKETGNETLKQWNNEIAEGDHVVHEDHGIAIFRGTTFQEIEGIKKEFFILEYKDRDKLYVPIELVDKIDKYFGLANPPIHRLHGSSWLQITKKIKEQAEKVAKELLALYAEREIASAPAFSPKTPEERELESSFPYEETPDQLKTLKEIEQDLKQTKPADRLVCGDVGFGKTEVAIRAAFKAVMNGFQVALLCPTTILAQQHYDTFLARLKKFPVNIEVLSRFKSKSQQKKIITQTKNGFIDILIGTHRLLSRDISFKNLGLIIIDEEQRFGVKHKEKLKKLRTQAHILTLTATPIPRTLNFSLSGIRDLSLILTPPPGRQKIKTFIKQFSESDIKNAIEQELKRQGQVYFVHNQVETINLITKKLSCLLPRARFGIAHGQLKEAKLAQVMSDFDNGKIDVLVCSTIIENGLDLPNVNTLIVDNATKFGLAQLYQLRGRVGRSDRQAYAYFLYHRLNSSKKINPPIYWGDSGDSKGSSTTPGHQFIGGQLTQKELARLKALKQAEELGSGFQLALRDLEIRGVGNILGKKQHGAVAAIGLSLYTRLLSNSVEELKTGQKAVPIPDISIDLPLASGIPPELEPNEPKRLNLYQHLASIQNLNELKSIRDQFACPQSPERNDGRRAKKYSRPIREKLQNLLHLLEIKLLAQQTSISSIDTSFGLAIDGTRKKRVAIKFKEPLNQQKFLKLLSTQPYWKQAPNQIKINLEDLGKNWVEKLKQTIRIFT